MICWRCDEAITPEQKFDSYAKVGMSSDGHVIHVHDRCPKVAYYLSMLLRRRFR